MQNIKTTISKILLCIYVFALIRSLGPLISDIVAHTFFEAQHLATVHLHHGEHHLHDELEEEDEDSAHDHHHHDSNGANRLVSENKALEAYLTTSIAGFISYPESIKNCVLSENNQLPDGFIQKVTPPPKA
jgi:ABC-type nickel/cobalt efflux system permease component RcnA